MEGKARDGQELKWKARLSRKSKEMQGWERQDNESPREKALGKSMWGWVSQAVEGKEEQDNKLCGGVNKTMQGVSRQGKGNLKKDRQGKVRLGNKISHIIARYGHAGQHRL